MRCLRLWLDADAPATTRLPSVTRNGYPDRLHFGGTCSSRNSWKRVARLGDETA
ncbi:hypothetical protein OKW27_003843 [Paraburkholderia sp. 35.1]